MATYARLLNADSVEVNSIRSVAGGVVAFPNGILADTIAENTASAGVTVAGLLIKSGAIDTGLTTFTPSFTSSAGGLTATTVFYARWSKVGKSISGRISFGATQTGPDGPYWQFTSPIAAANFSDDQTSPISILVGGTFYQGFIQFLKNTTTARVRFYPSSGFSAFPTGTVAIVSGEFAYESV